MCSILKIILTPKFTPNKLPPHMVDCHRWILLQFMILITQIISIWLYLTNLLPLDTPYPLQGSITISSLLSAWTKQEEREGNTNRDLPLCMCSERYIDCDTILVNKRTVENTIQKSLERLSTITSGDEGLSDGEGNGFTIRKTLAHFDVVSNEIIFKKIP